MVLKILVADDEFANLETLGAALEAAGHRVLRAGDGADALRILTSQTPDVVVCDEEMPVIAGSQLVDAMRATSRLSRIPVILMTAPPGGASSVEGTTLVSMVKKPVMVPQLLALIEQLHRDAVRE